MRRINAAIKEDGKGKRERCFRESTYQEKELHNTNQELILTKKCVL